MRRTFLPCIGLLLAALLPALAQDRPPTWSADPRTGCRVWNAYPAEDEQMHWNGDCRDGLAEGPGLLIWFLKGEAQSRTTGTMRAGRLQGPVRHEFVGGNRYEGGWRDDRMHGHGVFVWAEGDRFEGNYENDRPNGYGTFRRADGEVFRGEWKNGCFDEKGRRANIAATEEECGFK